MKDIKGTKTEQNLLAAFAGESMARNRYTYYASKAKKDGYEQIAECFTLTAANEQEHAKLWFKLLHGGIAGTPDNLKDAATGERAEWTEMYKEFAEVAQKEGFAEIAALFSGVGAIEKEHEERFLALLNNIQSGEVFSRDEEMVWECRNCGHRHIGKTAPSVCPVCSHPQSFFMLVCENY